MESLVEKWKNTINSRNFSTSFRESQGTAEKPPKKPVFPSNSNKKPLKKPETSSSSSSSEDISLDLFKKKKNSKGKVEKKPAESANLHRKSPKTEKTGDIVKESVYLVLDLFENEDAPLKGLKKILENVHEDGKKRAISPEIEQDGADFKGICSESARKKQNFKEKLEGSSKILSELENKLFQSEKEKLQLRSEKEQLIIKLNKAEEECRLKKINCELVERLQESHKILERNNVSLLNQLEEAHLRIENQQKIFDFQINELTEIFEKIKKQTE